MEKVTVIGGGLAGSEAALQLARNKIYVDFENLDLSKIDGFEEAKKVVENNG